MIDQTDTIVAISTPPGRGGIGIVRLSGPEAVLIATSLLRLQSPLAHAKARLAHVLDPTNPERVLDEALVTLFLAPRSYTTQDVVEIACHAAPILLDTLVRACLAHGAHLAAPGEFTQRAFLAGRLDLTQAEAVHDLIAASTLHQARTAAAQLGGSLSRTVTAHKQSLIALIAALEAGVDFAEDDIDLLPDQIILTRVQTILTPLEALSATFLYGRILREGLTIALIGRPNAGKSSLFNRLLGRDRAIVTPQPGTTRDALSETFALDGIPVHLVDTAGLRALPIGPEGEAERQGIARTHTTIAEADLILHVIDATDTELKDQPPDPTRPHLLILNKSDLLTPHAPIASGAILTSALTGQGIELLKRAILRAITQSSPAPETPLLTNLRQQQAVQSAVSALTAASQGAANHLPHELLLLDLYAALAALDELTGATSNQAILNLIFSSFCIGK